MTDYPVIHKTRPTFYFIGVTTGQSSINSIFPLWMQALGRPEIALEGIDHPLHDAPENYRQTVAQIKYDPNSIGGLVTTHKLDLFAAAADMFDDFDPYAQATHELSCISKRDGRLRGHAKDPISVGLSLEAIIGRGYFGQTGAEVLCLGAGGSALALLLHLINRPDAADRPRRFTAVSLTRDRLEHMRAMAAQFQTDIEVIGVQNADPRRNDELLAALPDHSIVINATGMGKDTPGSPITDAGVFPLRGIAWEFNYRGALDFMQQALRQREARSLRVEDGWVYFLHGWTQVIFEALDIPATPELFQRLAAAARAR